jgi:Tol biopolymer transport system component
MVLTALAGCSAPTKTPDPDLGPEPGFIITEGDNDFLTDSVSWLQAPEGPDRFAFITIALRVPIDAVSHHLLTGAVTVGCLDYRCFPPTTPVFGQPRFTIANLDWSPVGNEVAYDGHAFGETENWIHVLTPGGEPRAWVTGYEPTFSPDGGNLVYVEIGRDAIRTLGLGGSGDQVERDGLTGVRHPRISPDGQRIAYAAMDGDRGQRIFVVPRGEPDRIPDAVSMPDRLPGGLSNADGTDDDYPAWSPSGRYVAYRSRLRDGTLRDAIFVTEPDTEPENVVKIVVAVPGTQMSCLRWHPRGDVMLLILDGNVYTYTMPERYRE